MFQKMSRMKENSRTEGSNYLSTSRVWIESPREGIKRPAIQSLTFAQQESEAVS